jgi:hypothetical protein
MSVEIWRGYFDPVGHLPERGLASQPGDILIHQRSYLFHSSIPFCIFGGLVILHLNWVTRMQVMMASFSSQRCSPKCLAFIYPAFPFKFTLQH